jgi:hypothetical protein
MRLYHAGLGGIVLIVLAIGLKCSRLQTRPRTMDFKDDKNP